MPLGPNATFGIEYLTHHVPFILQPLKLQNKLVNDTSKPILGQEITREGWGEAPKVAMLV